MTSPLSVEAALSLLAKGTHPLPAESIPVGTAVGRRTAEPVLAVRPLPAFDNSAMDGYAVHASDARSAGTRLRIEGRSVAGGTYDLPVPPGSAVRIFTGAPMPPGADAVVMQEDVTIDPDGLHLRLTEGITPWENVRFRGEDVESGATLLERGTEVGPQHLGALLAAGEGRIAVHRRPRVALIANGSELCAPGKPLRPGQIPESNTSVLAALIQRVGAEPVLTDLVPDDRTQLREALKRAAAESDLVITVGGASVGDLDLVRPALMDAGGTLDFWRIAMKPGKPFLCGRLDATPIYGLPGNPVSAFVTAVVLVLPVLRLLQGSSTGAPPLRWCRWNSAAENPDRRRHFVRVQTNLDGTIRLSGQQGSHRMMSLAASDGLVDLAPGARVGPGDLSPVIGW